MDTGQNICLFLFTSIFISNIREFNVYITVLVKRLYDRGFRLGLKVDPDDEYDDQIYTKKKV